MQERRVTAGGETHTLPDPFFVLATQNPIDLEGTYPLPEAQLDRFLFKLVVGANSADVLRRIVMHRELGAEPVVAPVLAREEFTALLALVRRVHLPEVVADYIARLVHASQPGASEAAAGVRFGASPRAALALAAAGRARAIRHGRPHLSFEDVQAVARPVLGHRIILEHTARLDGATPAGVVETPRRHPRAVETAPGHPRSRENRMNAFKVGRFIANAPIRLALLAAAVALLALAPAALRAGPPVTIPTTPGSGLTLRLSTPLTQLPHFGFIPVQASVENLSARDGEWDVQFTVGNGGAAAPLNLASRHTLAVPAGQSRELWLYVPVARAGFATNVPGGSIGPAPIISNTPTGTRSHAHDDFVLGTGAHDDGQRDQRNHRRAHEPKYR